jgi:hypothetical protein
MTVPGAAPTGRCCRPPSHRSRWNGSVSCKGSPRRALEPKQDRGICGRSIPSQLDTLGERTAQHAGEPHHLLRCDADVDVSIHVFPKRQTSLMRATNLEPECRSISYQLEDVADRNHVGRGDFAEDGQAVGEIARVFGLLEHRQQEP